MICILTERSPLKIIDRGGSAPAHEKHGKQQCQHKQHCHGGKPERLALIKRFKEEDLTYYKLCEEVRKENNLMIKGEKPSESKNSPHRMSVYKNTVMKAVEMLKNYCANVETEENENENVYEIKLRIYK